MNYLILGLIAIPLLSVKVLAQHIGYPVAASVMIAANNAPEKAIDEWTDNIFYKLHPQLNRRKIRPNETQYINEWAAIRKVLRDGNLVYERGCGPSYWWHLSEFDTPGRNPREIVVFSSVLNKVADAIFYTRNPDLGYRAIQRSETRLASEWSKIRQGVSLVHPCYY
ncbi:MAG: hypothetical protein EAZ78_03700 [Oscillatoriales cyanobacterium]|uniref:hypothetical protein n=1 Tax=Microcoleus anatoxicus TaxID=2705319 RepID=UPI002978C9A3|nr:MAG: hypothetical protein EAZ78_03700 [Oscillatoriales cyanobacterium]TAF64637.1 MAG: hypothetical protein EAZ59_18055 [Oscillatoriales cyanobacterium]